MAKIRHQEEKPGRMMQAMFRWPRLLGCRRALWEVGSWQANGVSCAPQILHQAESGGRFLPPWMRKPPASVCPVLLPGTLP